MKSVASTPLRFISMLVAANGVLFGAVISLVALLGSNAAIKSARRFDNLLSTQHFSSAVHHVNRSGAIGLIACGVAVIGIVMCLRSPRIAALIFVGCGIVGAILSPFTFGFAAFFLLNAAVIVFFGRKEIPTKLVKEKAEEIEPVPAAPAIDAPPAPA